MREIRIEKLTINIGAGKDQNKLEKAMKLVKNITGITPVKTVTQKRIAAWGLRPGLPIGCKVTLRKQEANKLLSRVLDAKDYKLKATQFDNNGNVAFGVSEYINIKDAKYDTEVGMMGLEVCLTLERPGYRVKKRRIRKSKISPKHRIAKEDAIEFLKRKFNVKMEEE